MIPQDPVMLLSYINTKLRDECDSLESLAEELDISMGELNTISDKLQGIGYSYDESKNQFV